MLPKIDLANKCGSCCYFKAIGETTQGECLQNPYGEDVVHDPEHPYWIVQRSRIKCRLYNTKPQTNADRIRAMSDEELADWLARTQMGAIKDAMAILQFPCDATDEIVELGTRESLLWLKQPADER